MFIRLAPTVDSHIELLVVPCLNVLVSARAFLTATFGRIDTRSQTSFIRLFMETENDNKGVSDRTKVGNPMTKQMTWRQTRIICSSLLSRSVYCHACILRPRAIGRI